MSQKESFAHVGMFIQKLRESRNLTQKDLAEMLETSQSAIARIEAGKQNLTLKEIDKFSKALGKKIIGISDSVDFKIVGGKKLKGSVATNTSKNGAINMFCASLINRGKTVLHGIPHIEEVYRYIEIMESMGVSVKWIKDHSVEIIVPKKLKIASIDKDTAARTRSFTFVGGLLHHSNNFSFPHSGGCKMGERTIAAHKYGLEYMGAEVVTKDDRYEISHKGLHGSRIPMYESSDTGAINLLIAAAGIEEETTLLFAPPNYQVQDVCFLLQKYGVEIEGVGTTTLKIRGKKDIHVDVEHHNSEDPIESMFFIAAGIVTKSTLTVERCPIDFLELELEKLKRMGLVYTKSKNYLSHNGKTLLTDITVKPSKLHSAGDKIHTQPYPGINNDNLPFFVPISALAEGTTLIHDWTWENRAIYFTELNRLGAQIKLLDPHRALVNGVTELRGAQIVSPPALRPTAIILIAMLAAKGTSVLRNVYSIRRGYEDIATRLAKLGADIEVVREI